MFFVFFFMLSIPTKNIVKVRNIEHRKSRRVMQECKHQNIRQVKSCDQIRIGMQAVVRKLVETLFNESIIEKLQI